MEQLPDDLKKDAQFLYSKYLSKKNQSEQMWDYYIGNTDIDIKYPLSKFGNNRKVKANYIKKFINEEVAFGNDITYRRQLTIDEVLKGITIPEDDQEVNLIHAVIKKNPTADVSLMTNLLVFGEAMEMYYVDDNMVKIRGLNPLNCYVRLDINGEKVESAIYIYQDINQDNKIFINYFTKNAVYTLDESLNALDKQEHYFGIVPVSYCRLIDGAYNTLFNDLKKIQDNLENIISDYSNEIGDNRMSYLILKNLGLSDEEIEDLKQKNGGEEPTPSQITGTIVEHFKNNGIILMDSDKEIQTDASFLVKNISSDVYKNMLDFTVDMLYQLSQHINLNQQQSSNTSGVALMTRVISLRNKIKVQQNCMTRAIRTRIECIISWINSKFEQNLDADKIGINYTLNVPSDDSATADIITKLVPSGIMSAETGLSNLSFISNPKAEYEKAKAEMKEKEDSMSDLGDIHV